MQRGVATDIGSSALLAVGEVPVSVVVSSLRHQSIDQAVFRHLGAEPAAYRIVGVKSTVHFRTDFAPIAKAVLMVKTPGYSRCRLDPGLFRNLRPGARLV